MQVQALEDRVAKLQSNLENVSDDAYITKNIVNTS